MGDKNVNLDTAILAKEMGFKPLNPSTQYVKGFTEQWDDVTNTVTGYKENEIQEEDYVREGYFLRPTQTVLQKWLRENHNIEISVLRYTYSGGVYQGKCYMWFVDQYDDKYNYELEENDEYWILNERKSQGYEFKTYEEALEQALITALKLVGNQSVESEYGNGNYGEGIRV